MQVLPDQWRYLALTLPKPDTTKSAPPVAASGLGAAAGAQGGAQSGDFGRNGCWSFVGGDYKSSYPHRVKKHHDKK